MKKIISAAFALLSLTSCMTEVLTVHMDYVSHSHLASTYVNTPDPQLEHAFAGQRLIISWWIPLHDQGCGPFEIRLKLRYGNREEAATVIPFKGRQGWYVYALTNEDYFEKKGIQTYHVQLYAGEKLIEQWQHQLWVQLVEFPPEGEDDDSDIDFDEDSDIDFDEEDEDSPPRL